MSITGLMTVPVLLKHKECAPHFPDADFLWDAMPYFPGSIDWTQAELMPDSLRMIDSAMKDTDFRHFFFVHQWLDPHAEQRHPVQNASKVRSMPAQGRTSAVFQGHYHSDFASRIEGILYITLPALCEKRKTVYC